MSTCILCKAEHNGRGSYCANCLLHPPRSARTKTKSQRRHKGRRHDPAPTSSRAIPSASSTEEQYDRILACLRENGPMTRRDLWKTTSIDYNVVTPRVRELLDAGRLVEGRSVLNEDSGAMAREVMLPHGRAYVEPQQAFSLEEEAS
jgi:hypothetical protein